MLVYKLKDKIIDVLNFKTNHVQLIYKNKSKQIIWNDSIISENVLDDIHLKDNYVIFNRKNITNIIDLQTLIGTKIDDLEVLNTNNYKNNSIILINQKQSLFQFDIDIQRKTKLNIEDYDWGFILLWEENIILLDRYLIHCYTLPSAVPLWSFPLSSLGTNDTSDKEVKTPEVQQFIGVYEEKLWVRTDKGHFFALDINSGQLLHHIQGVNSYDIHGHIDEYLGETDLYQFFFRNNYILDTDRGLIIGLGGDRYFEIDLNSEPPKSSIYGMMDQMKEFGIKSGNIGYNQVLLDNNLYFIAHEQGVFGIIDTITKKIIYVSDPIEISSKNGFPPQLKEIQVSGDNVYVLASDNTLHIFEKENV